MATWIIDRTINLDEIKTKKTLNILINNPNASDEKIENLMREENVVKESSKEGFLSKRWRTFLKSYGLYDDNGITEMGRLYASPSFKLNEFSLLQLIKHTQLIGNTQYLRPFKIVLAVFNKLLQEDTLENTYLTHLEFENFLVKAQDESENTINQIVESIKNARLNKISLQEQTEHTDIYFNLFINTGLFKKSSSDLYLEPKNIGMFKFIVDFYSENNEINPNSYTVFDDDFVKFIPNIKLSKSDSSNTKDKFVDGTILFRYIFKSSLLKNISQDLIKKCLEKYSIDTEEESNENIYGIFKHFPTIPLFKLYHSDDNLNKYEDRKALNIEIANTIYFDLYYGITSTKDIDDDENTEIVTDKKTSSNDSNSNIPKATIKGSNIIYYGAPGTGKSHGLNEKSKEFNFLERVTFYPEYTHDEFIGCFMPSMSYIKDDSTKYISADGKDSNLPGKPIPYYTYIAGPFTNALVYALNNPSENVLLIVEELNRANAAAVFGEFFQLLDRTETGESKYAISVSNEYSEYISSKVESYSKGDKIKLPNNLTICATMNSADQGVNPLDSAFKRRWIFKYVPIDFSKATHKDATISYANNKITWENFATTINEKLKTKEVNEDKHLGQYFVTEAEINDSDAFSSKILLYLFDDVLKFNRKGFFNGNYKTFSDLLKGFLNGKKIFAFDFENAMESSSITYPEKSQEADIQMVAEDYRNEFENKDL